jgi:hypothetical protein
MCERVATIGDLAGREFADLVRGTTNARVRARMNCAVLVASTLVALAGTASANTYIGIGIGPSPAISGDDRLESVGRSGKLLVGFNFGVPGRSPKFAVEGSIGRNGALFSDQQDGAVTVLQPYGNMYQAAVSGKLNFVLGNNFEAFGRLGLHHIQADASDQPTRRDTLDVSGNGFLVGGGIEYKLKLGVGGGIFLDYTISKAELTNDLSALKFDVTMRTWTLGLTFGF